MKCEKCGKKIDQQTISFFLKKSIQKNGQAQSRKFAAHVWLRQYFICSTKLKMKHKLAKLLFNLLGPDHGGTPSPPGVECSLAFGDADPGDNNRPMHVASVGNDGFELWLGGYHHWDVFYRAKDARKLAWFILWTWWAKSTWFGIKRRLWYWSLRQEVEKMREWKRPETDEKRP